MFAPAHQGVVLFGVLRAGRRETGLVISPPSALIRAVVYSAEGLSTVMCSVGEAWVGELSAGFLMRLS